jgi:hypothetical protein
MGRFEASAALSARTVKRPLNAAADLAASTFDSAKNVRHT